MIFRKAKERDIKQIAILITDLLGTCNLDKEESIIKTNTDEISETINNYYVCTLNNKVIGACGISELLEKDNYNLGLSNVKEILYLVVDKAYQGNGIGTKLLEKCTSKNDCDIIYEAWGDNGKYVNSKYVLEKCGFKLFKDLGNDYYKNNNYCNKCVNRNKNCDSCLAQIWIKRSLENERFNENELL